MGKISFRIGLILFFLILLPISYSLSSLEEDTSIEDTPGEEIKLYLGQMEVFTVDSPTRVVIGSPNIADVVDVTENSIVLAPKAVGTTTFVFWDNSGEQSFRIRVLPEDINDIKLRIDNILKELNLPNVYTKAVETEGKVLLLGEVGTTQDKEHTDLALGTLKEKTTNLIKIKEEAIVEIDVQVLELNRDATKTLGFNMPSSISATETAGRFPLALRSSMDAIFHVFDWPRTTTFTTTLNLLIEEGKARVLSQPRLACLSGKEAELLVGGEKPIFTTEVAASGGEGTEVEYKEYGIKLKIKPTVTDKDKIQLALNVEVSEVGTAETIGSQTTTTARAYPLTKRNVSTELFLKSGQTMVIGGLIKQKAEEDIHKTAFLGDIPIIGALFRRKTTKAGGGFGERGDVELFITLTPNIVAAKEPTKDYSERPGLTVETKPQGAQEELIPELKDYIKSVQLKIINAVYYPAEAKDLGLAGTVNLILCLSSDGSLKEAKITQSSGYKLLDEAALEVVQKQAPYPAFPYQVKSEELKIQVPIVYRKN